MMNFVEDKWQISWAINPAVVSDCGASGVELWLDGLGSKTLNLDDQAIV